MNNSDSALLCSQAFVKSAVFHSKQQSIDNIIYGKAFSEKKHI